MEHHFCKDKYCQCEIDKLESERDRYRHGLERIENGDACDDCKADKDHIRFYDNDGEFVHSCRKAIARDSLINK